MLHTIKRYCMQAIFFTVIVLVPMSAVLGQTGNNGPDADIPSVSDTLTVVGQGANYEPVAQNQAVFRFAEIIGRVIGVFLSLLGVIMIILMIYAGYLWMTAQGNDEQVKKAKDLIRNTIIGFIIIIASYAVTYFVLSALAAYNQNLQGFR